jgi:transposase
VTTDVVALALATVARDEGIDADHRAVRVLDQAGWHTSPELALPNGIDVLFLPSASPEWPPAERLWPLVDEPVVNRAFPDVDTLETVLVNRCRTLEADRGQITSHTPSSPGGRPNTRHDCSGVRPVLVLI